MSRKITVGAAQLGPIARNEGRPAVVARLIELMREARARGCAGGQQHGRQNDGVPELALLTDSMGWRSDRHG